MTEIRSLSYSQEGVLGKTYLCFRNCLSLIPSNLWIIYDSIMRYGDNGQTNYQTEDKNNRFSRLFDHKHQSFWVSIIKMRL